MFFWAFFRQESAETPQPRLFGPRVLWSCGAFWVRENYRPPSAEPLLWAMAAHLPGTKPTQLWAWCGWGYVVHLSAFDFWVAIFFWSKSGLFLSVFFWKQLLCHLFFWFCCCCFCFFWCFCFCFVPFFAFAGFCLFHHPHLPHHPSSSSHPYRQHQQWRRQRQQQQEQW